MNKFKKWLIMKLAGDTVVILNTAILYKYYPIFANTDFKPIVENNLIIPSNASTPFTIYDKRTFEIIGDELNIHEDSKKAYDEVVDAINKAESPLEKQDAIANEASSKDEIVV